MHPSRFRERRFFFSGSTFIIENQKDRTKLPRTVGGRVGLGSGPRRAPPPDGPRRVRSRVTRVFPPPPASPLRREATLRVSTDDEVARVILRILHSRALVDRTSQARSPRRLCVYVDHSGVLCHLLLD